MEVAPGFDGLAMWSAHLPQLHQQRAGTDHDHPLLQWQPQPQILKERLRPRLLRRQLQQRVVDHRLRRARHVVHVHAEAVSEPVRVEGPAEAEVEDDRLELVVREFLVRWALEDTELDEAVDENAVREGVD